MPNCFALQSKKDGQRQNLNDVDAAIASHLGIPCDPKQWCMGWYHCIGFLLATKGYALDDPRLRDEITRWYDDDTDAARYFHTETLKALDYMIEHYTADAWAEIGKR